MNASPLLQTFNKNIKDTEMTLRQTKSLLTNISNLDNEGKEILYVLIKSYNIKNEPNNMNTIPYKGNYDGDKLTFDIDDFPNKLKHILAKFSRMHLRKMREDIKKQ